VEEDSSTNEEKRRLHQKDTAVLEAETNALASTAEETSTFTCITNSLCKLQNKVCRNSAAVQH